MSSSRPSARPPTRTRPTRRAAWPGRWIPTTPSRTHVDDTLRVGDGLCHRDIVELCAREAPEHILWFANELGVPFDRDATGHLALGREGGHTARRIVHAKDSTGWAIQEALLAGVARAHRPDHDAARSHGDRSADDREVRRAERRVRRLPARSDDRQRRGGGRARGRAGDRRLGQGLPLHVEPGRRDRRRRRDGVPRGRARREHGVLPVPPDLPLSPGGEVVPDHGGDARRGRHPAPARRHGVHAALPRDEGPRPARRRVARDRRRDEADRRRLRRARHDPPVGRLPGRSLPEHPQALHGAGDRHAQAADPGRSRRPLQLRRHRRRRARADDRPQPVRDRRGVDDRSARRLPAGVQLAARGDGLRRARRGRRARTPRSRARRTSRPGTRARRARPTRWSSSATTGTRSAA